MAFSFGSADAGNRLVIRIERRAVRLIEVKASKSLSVWRAKGAGCMVSQVLVPHVIA